MKYKKFFPGFVLILDLKEINDYLKPTNLNCICIHLRNKIEFLKYAWKYIEINFKNKQSNK